MTERGVELQPLFGRRAGGKLALVARRWLFARGVEPTDGGDVARLHARGLPEVMVRVAGDVWLGVVELASRWPFLVGELVERAGDAAAREILDGALLFRPDPGEGELAALVLQYGIHADDLHLLGERTELPAPPRWCRTAAFAFEGGVLELAYPAEEVAPRNRVRPVTGVRATWRGAPLDLEATIAWREDELSELFGLIVGTCAEDPDLAVELCEAAVDEPALVRAGEGSARARERAGAVSLAWGMSLRCAGRALEALPHLERALEMAHTDLQRGNAYFERAFARLSTTAAPMPPEARRFGPMIHDLREENRSTWVSCAEDLERAIALVPSHEDAIALLARVRGCLAGLEGLGLGAPPAARAAASASPVREARPRAGGARPHDEKRRARAAPPPVRPAPPPPGEVGLFSSLRFKDGVLAVVLFSLTGVLLFLRFCR